MYLIDIGVSLGDSSAKIKRLLKIVCDNLDRESEEFTLLASKLEEIVLQYEMTESNIMGKDVTKKSSDNKAETSNVIDSKDNSSSEDNATKELIWTILGFVPGLNCIADVRQIVIDFEKAAADGDLSNSEILAILMDFAFLVMDTVSVLSLAKNIAKGVNAAKLASTAAKTAGKKATAAAKAAEKAASKTGGTVAKTAKKEAAKEAAKNVARDTGKNVVDKYVPTKGNNSVPNKVLEDAKDTLLDEGA